MPPGWSGARPALVQCPSYTKDVRVPGPASSISEIGTRDVADESWMRSTSA